MTDIKLTLQSANSGDITVEFADKNLSMSLALTWLTDSLARIDSVPFFAESVNLKDVIEVERRADDSARFIRVHQASHWRIYTFMLSQAEVDGVVIPEFCRQLEELDGHWELVFGGCLLVGLPPDVMVDPNDLLERLRNTVH